MRNSAVITLIFVLWAATAHAQSVESVLKEFGLLRGSWAANCSKGPSTSNWYGRFRADPSGKVSLTYSSSRSSRGDNVYVIHIARRLSKTDVLMAHEFVREKRMLEIVLHVESNRYRTVSSKRPDGTYQVKNGKFKGGGDSPWLNRCN